MGIKRKKIILFNNYRLKQPTVIIPLFAGPPHTNEKPLKVNCVRSHHMWICLMFVWVFDSLFCRGCCVFVCVSVCLDIDFTGECVVFVCFWWKKCDDAAEKRASSTLLLLLVFAMASRSKWKGWFAFVESKITHFRLQSQIQCQCTHIRFLIEPQFRIMHFKSPSNSQC